MANETFKDASGLTKYRKSSGAGSTGDPAVTHVNIDSSVLPAGAATSALQTTLNTLAAGGLPAALGAGGGLKVDGSGTPLPVSGAFWQATQPVSGSVSITGSVAVTGTFWQATQPVSGTFWQATQPVSNGGTFAVQPGCATSGGELSHSAISTAAVYTQQVKGSAGQAYSLDMFNKGAAPVYVRLYDQTGAPASTDGANIIWRGMVPGNTSAGGFVKEWPKGKACVSGLGIRVSAGAADNDTAVLAANEVYINVGYK